MMSWRKLNYLVPNPQCRTDDGVITEWTDARLQPTDTEINAVLESDIQAIESQAEEDNFNFPDVMKTIAKAFHNHENRIRALEGKQSVTKRQVIKALRKL